MRYSMEAVGEVLRAELVGRETIDETREFLGALAARALESGLKRVLIVVRDSRTIFQVQKYGIADYLRQLSENTEYRVALVADSSEGRAAQEYIQTLARLQRANVRAFRDEAAAMDWLKGSIPGEAVKQSEPARGPGLGTQR
jgi:hypothetical protein